MNALIATSFELRWGNITLCHSHLSFEAFRHLALISPVNRRFGSCLNHPIAQQARDNFRVPCTALKASRIILADQRK